MKKLENNRGRRVPLWCSYWPNNLGDAGLWLCCRIPIVGVGAERSTAVHCMPIEVDMEGIIALGRLDPFDNGS